MGHELFEALSSHSFLLELLQEAFKEETDRTTEEMEGRTAKTKVIIYKKEPGLGERLKERKIKS